MVDGVWYAQQPGTPFYGRGETIEAACIDLSARADEYEAFSSASGLQPFVANNVSIGASRLLDSFWRNFRVVIIVALCCIPLSYAISTGVKRGFDVQSNTKMGREFWTKVEKALIAQGAEDKQLPPEKVEQLSKSLANIIEQARPFTSHLPLLFEPPQKAQGSIEPSGTEKIAQ